MSPAELDQLYMSGAHVREAALSEAAELMLEQAVEEVKKGEYCALIKARKIGIYYLSEQAIAERLRELGYRVSDPTKPGPLLYFKQ